MNWLKKSVAFIMGIIFTLGIFEIFLRLFYSNDYKPISYATDSKIAAYNILFLGNSHTYGAGVKPEDSYPGVLQRFFDKNLKDKDIKVVVTNAGKNTINTTEINQELDAQIIKFKPNLVHIMAGEPNYWNKNGLGEYLTEKTGQGLGFWTKNFVVLSHYSKAIKWITSIEWLSRAFVIDRQTEDEILFYKEITETEDHYRKVIDNNAKNQRILNVFNAFIDKHRSEPPHDLWRVILYINSRYKLFLNKDYAVIINQIKQSIEFSPDRFDIFSYILIEEMLNFHKLDESIRIQLKNIQKDLEITNVSPGLDISKKCYYLELHSNLKVFTPEEKDVALDHCHKLFPMFAVATIELSKNSINHHNNYGKSFDAILDTMKLNPFAQRSEIKRAFVNIIESRISTPEQKKSAHEILENFTKKYPSEAHLFIVNNWDQVNEWIAADLNKIALKSRAAGSNVVIQNYHWLRNKPEESAVNQAILKASIDYGISFIDMNSYFKEVVQQRGNADSFFVQEFGPNDSHPSEKGHRIIAYKIYKSLVEQKLLPENLSHFDPEEILAGLN